MLMEASRDLRFLLTVEKPSIRRRTARISPFMISRTGRLVRSRLTANRSIESRSIRPAPLLSRAARTAPSGWVRADGSEPHFLFGHDEGRFVSIAVSPDGRRIASSVRTARSASGPCRTSPSRRSTPCRARSSSPSSRPSPTSASSATRVRHRLEAHPRPVPGVGDGTRHGEPPPTRPPGSKDARSPAHPAGKHGTRSREQGGAPAHPERGGRDGRACRSL